MVIIGAGIVGVTAARELSKYKLNTVVLEMNADVGEGTTKANSGIIHAGYDCEPGTQKAKLNVLGNELYNKLVEELHIPYRKNGAFVLAFSESDMPVLKYEFVKAEANGVPDVRMFGHDEILSMEKNINPNVYAALYAPTSGIISPYEAAIAFAESAYLNGVNFCLNTKVTNIEKIDGYYNISTEKGIFQAKAVVNAAGLYSDTMNNYVSAKKYEIFPRRGEYLLFDRSAGSLMNITVFQLPTKLGKGVLISPTVHGNMFIGPSAEDIDDKGSTITTAAGLQKITLEARLTSSAIPMDKVITSFTGLRACLKGNDDFVVEEAQDAPGFINCLGINSPGLSSAPAIAQKIAEMICNRLQPDFNNAFIAERQPIKLLREQSLEEQNRMIAENTRYGVIVCRCETVTEGDVVDAITRPLGARNIDSVKRRTRAGGGRCQGGFCGSKVMEILARELNIKPAEVTKYGGGSNILYERRNGVS